MHSENVILWEKFEQETLENFNGSWSLDLDFQEESFAFNRILDSAGFSGIFAILEGNMLTINILYDGFLFVVPAEQHGLLKTSSF